MIFGREVRYYSVMVKAVPDLIRLAGARIALQVVCCLAFLCPQPVQAIKVPGLYEAEVIVENQSVEDRTAAIRACLSRVLVKLTGVRNVSGIIELQPILEQSGNFVQQYRYLEMQIDAPPPTAESVPVQWRLAVKFDEVNLNKSLRESGIPVWGRERPSILIWLALEQANRRSFADADSVPELLELVHGLAHRRGVSILFPLQDLDDGKQIRPGDVWLGFQEPIMAASGRYNTDVILTASVDSPVPGIWEGRWRSYGDDGLSHEWTTETDLLEGALEEGFNGFVDILAAEFVRTGSYTLLGDIEITVADVNSVEQYARLIDYLESLSSISEVHVMEVRTGEVKLALTAHGGEPVVVQTIGLGRTLEPVDNPDGHYYRLIP